MFLLFNRKITVLVISLFLLFACSHKPYNPRNGDLLFQVAGTSSFSEAITKSTAWRDSLQFDHVGIVAMEHGKPYIIEASAKKGVVCTPFDDFIDSSARVNGRPGVVVMRVNANFHADEAVLRAKSHLGEAYDWAYYPNNGKMYCSELVYESFRHQDGTPMFTARPMNFRDSQGQFPAFWVQLFSQLGDTIPQGVLGTNPNDLAKEPILTEVFRFF